jgi:N4-gp56 family major capsid protein
MTVTRTTLPPEVALNMAEKMLSTPQARLIHKIAMDEHTYPANEGDIMRFSRFNRLETVPVPVSPLMLNPPAQSLTRVDIDAKIEFHATYIPITKQVTLINNDPVLNNAALRLGQCLRETEDQLIRDMLESTLGAVNAVNGTNGDNPTNLTREDVDDIVASLQNADGEFVTEMIEAEDKIGTGPIRDAYIAMAHTRLIGQLEAVDGFKEKNQYPNQGSVLSSEWGSISNARYFLSSRGSVTHSGSALGNDVYNIYYAAQEAYSGIYLEAGMAKYIYHGPGHGDDPCELRQTVGFSFPFATNITNDAWIIKQAVTLG